MRASVGSHDGNMSRKKQSRGDFRNLDKANKDLLVNSKDQSINKYSIKLLENLKQERISSEQKQNNVCDLIRSEYT